MAALLFNPHDVIACYYPQDTPLRRLLLCHSTQVRDKALSLFSHSAFTHHDIDMDVVAAGALLHDIGIVQCHAPDIFCMGHSPYICHGMLGAQMLRDYGDRHGIDMSVFAAICEHHTGAGLTREDVVTGHLPLPEQDWLPVTLEEKLVCLADKFFSKSGEGGEKDLSAVRHSMVKFGAATMARFDELCRLFSL